MNKLLKKINFQDEKVKDIIAGSIALFFLVSAGVLAIQKFNTSLEISTLGTGGENGQIESNDSQYSNTSKRDEIISNGSVNSAQDTRWIANDYKQGEIKNGSYTVKSGDTLWEIAEAVYGDGNQWTKILETNKNSIGFLTNGSQALIIPGQVLQIP